MPLKSKPTGDDLGAILNEFELFNLITNEQIQSVSPMVTSQVKRSSRCIQMKRDD